MNDVDNICVSNSKIENREKYRSCHDLECGIIFFSEGVKHCCGLNKLGEEQKLIPYENSLEETIKRVLQEKKKIINENILGKKTICTLCNRLKDGMWNKEKKIRQINFSLDYICNLRCQYCDKWGNRYTHLEQRYIPEMMKRLEESEDVEIFFPVLYSSGEISILKNVDEIMSSFEKCSMCIFSNATKFQNVILEKLVNSSSCLVVSLDCGTKETYQKIKGVDLFEVVCNNIRKYSENGALVVLKYIITESNISEEDFNGFFQICQENRIDNVILSRDFYQQDDVQDIKKATTRFIRNAMKRNKNVYIDGVYDVFEKVYNMKFYLKEW